MMEKRLRPSLLLACTAVSVILPITTVINAQSIDIEGDQWYLTTDVPGVNLYVIEIGTGDDTLVVLHGGWGAEHSYLFDAFEGIEDDHHLVFYDQRGSLRSPCPDSLVSTANHVRDLERLREELHIDRLNLVGHSMGSFLAMRYLQEYPDHVGRMVLLGSIPVRGANTGDTNSLIIEQQAELGKFLKRPEIEQTYRNEGVAGEWTDLTDKQKTDKWRISFAGGNVFDVVHKWRRMKGGQVFYDQDAGAAAARDMGKSWDFRHALKNHSYPITFIAGSHDLADFGGVLNDYYLRDYDNVRHVVIDSAGHNIWIDRPDEFRRQLTDALKRE